MKKILAVIGLILVVTAGAAWAYLSEVNRRLQATPWSIRRSIAELDEGCCWWLPHLEPASYWIELETKGDVPDHLDLSLVDLTTGKKAAIGDKHKGGNDGTCCTILGDFRPADAHDYELRIDKRSARAMAARGDSFVIAIDHAERTNRTMKAYRLEQ